MNSCANVLVFSMQIVVFSCQAILSARSTLRSESSEDFVLVPCKISLFRVQSYVPRVPPEYAKCHTCFR